MWEALSTTNSCHRAKQSIHKTGWEEYYRTGTTSYSSDLTPCHFFFLEALGDHQEDLFRKHQSYQNGTERHPKRILPAMQRGIGKHIRLKWDYFKGKTM